MVERSIRWWVLGTQFGNRDKIASPIHSSNFIVLVCLKEGRLTFMVWCKYLVQAWKNVQSTQLNPLVTQVVEPTVLSALQCPVDFTVGVNSTWCSYFSSFTNLLCNEKKNMTEYTFLNKLWASSEFKYALFVDTKCLCTHPFHSHNLFYFVSFFHSYCWS